MPQVHFVRRARKNYRKQGIRKGQSYYWWQFYRSRMKCRSPVKPKPSQLTRSAYLGGILALQERVDELIISDDSETELIASELESVADDIEQLGQDCSDSKDNLPQSLQDSGPTAELLGERMEKCETLAQALRDAANEVRDIDSEDEDNEGVGEQIGQVISQIEWDF